jgi:coenzyme F420 hydrogenase subunit beta
MEDMSSNQQEFNMIIENGYCIGCGVCNVATNGVITNELDDSGCYRAAVPKAISEEESGRALSCCPFSDRGKNEDEIGEELFASDCKHNEMVGYYQGLYAGYVDEDDYRAKGTSGGLITWILAELLKRKEVDAILHVTSDDSRASGKLFKYGISQNEEDVKRGAKSRYYPVELSEALQHMKQVPGRYVVVGLPCFIKAVRKLSSIDPIIKERVKYCVGLVCGHLKSKAFADCFGWQVGISPGMLEEVDFRVKLPGRSAGNYGVYLRGAGIEETQPTHNFLGCNWGHNFFRYSACNYCDDVFAETADVVVGDAWVKEYEKDPKGNSVVVVRNAHLRNIIEEGRNEKKLTLNEEPLDVIISSQAGGLRDRREGLAYRLYLKKKKGLYYPQKRVIASKKNVSIPRRQVYRMRLLMEAESHASWKKAVEVDEFSQFEKNMGHLIKRNKFLYANVSKLMKAKAKTAIRRLLLLGRIK